jgi:hypothetical protein
LDGPRNASGGSTLSSLSMFCGNRGFPPAVTYLSNSTRNALIIHKYIVYSIGIEAKSVPNEAENIEIVAKDMNQSAERSRAKSKRLGQVVEGYPTQHQPKIQVATLPLRLRWRLVVSLAAGGRMCAPSALDTFDQGINPQSRFFLSELV